MKKAKRALAMLLCVVLLTGVICAPAYAIDASKYKYFNYESYTYIGDSIAWGFGLDRSKDPASADNVCSREKGAYGDLIGTFIEEKNGGKTYSAATSGARLSDYRMAVESGMGKENPYVLNDWYSENRSPDRSNKLRGMGTELCAWIKDSELVTVQLGYNDILAAPMFTIQDSGVLDELEEFADADLEIETIEDLISTELYLGKQFRSVFGSLADVLLSGLDSFRVNTRALVKDIIAVNPDADIVLVGYYNPYHTLKESANSDLTPFLDAFTVAVSAMNDWFSEIADIYDNVYYVDAMDVSLFFPEGMLYSEATEDGEFMLYGAHPDEAGHEYIANRILTVMNKVKSCPLFSYDSILSGAIFFPDNLLKTLAKVLAAVPVKIFTSIFPSFGK